ncbi:MAG TPA: periplasmic heavy metal sensor [Thermoanaerobaculia bacterium]|nr:periplasmic heavy metal sensor [Thermoanaerobaculia bacterium]
MKKRLILITLIVAAVAAVPFLYAAGPGHRGFRGHGMGGHGMHGMAFLGHLEHAKSELDLSDAQMEQLKAIVKETREQNGQYREQMHGTLKSIATTLLTNPNDVAGAQAVLDSQAAAEKQLKTNLIVAASKALNVLTPEQRTKLALHLAEHGKRWENRGR